VRFPATFLDLIRGGYVFLCRKRCEQCGREVTISLLPKKNKPAFVTPKNGRYLSHYAVCMSAELHLKDTK
jgi:hypothetical protein